MMNFKVILMTVLACTSVTNHAQNLPSLLLDKNINATFSIVAYDEKAKEWGIAVATDNIYVGNSTIYIQPGIGAFSVIAETEPDYGLKGLDLLETGQTIKQAISMVRNKDINTNNRQVSGIDAKGEVYAFTGQSLKYWQGHAGQILGENHVVMGNQLSSQVLTQMSQTFIDSKGTLAQRLLASLLAGQQAGGQISGKQSAAIVVKGLKHEWYNQIDLRVDHSKTPFLDLQRLMNYHYGRILLNQSLYAYRQDNADLAHHKLSKSASMLEGWTGIYAKVAVAHVLIHDDEAAAIPWIKKGLKENQNWQVNLPAFYFLKDHPEMKSIIKPGTFTVKDWESAIQMLSQLGREADVLGMAQDLNKSHIESSHLSFLIGRSYFYEKKIKQATSYLKSALELDPNHIEASQLLSQINALN